MQRTALEENGGADARTVFGGKTLDMQDAAVWL
jgi:hypothetical protein